jgi:hypothetical protein
MNLTPNVLLRSEQSGGHVSMIENVVPPRWAGPHLHTHDFDEGFYLLEGEYCEPVSALADPWIVMAAIAARTSRILTSGSRRAGQPAPAPARGAL